MASREIKVGVFVLLSLIVLGAVIFLLGDERRLFQQHMEMRTSFKDVAGLSRGSPVRMGGVDIGRVVGVAYGENPENHTIFVDMLIVSEEAKRIRRDSVATVEGKGLLGDKMVVITPGSMTSAPMREGEVIVSEESQDMEAIIGNLKETAADAGKVMKNLERTTTALSEETFTNDVKATVHHLNEVIASIDKGEGYIGRLIHSPEEADNLSTTIASFRKSAQELEALLASSRAVMNQVKTGPGFAHEVIYGQSGSQALAQVGGAAEELALALRGIRQGDSLAHNLLYEEESAKMVENLNRASEDLSAITADLREGKGTLGAFLTDPSVYEDIKVLLGNVGRNRSLRALVRYSIRQEEQAGRVNDPEAPKSGSGESGPSQKADGDRPPGEISGAAAGTTGASAAATTP
jgi:phospholipid/cholesterol/gamma-HCH transport system substrate-binding protein